MDRFFTKSETKSVVRPQGKKISCVDCGLFKNCKSPKMAPYGNFKKGILNIGEAPVEWEDQKGKPWQGKTGRLLQETYKKLGVDLFEDCLNINAVSCRPTEKDENRTPTASEIEVCRRNVLITIDKYKPKIIVLLGNVAVQSLIGYRWRRDLGGITKWRGWTIPDRDFGCWVCPTLHPSFIERGGQSEKTVWENDLNRIFGLVGTKLPPYKKVEVEIIKDIDALNSIQSGEVAIDYETTGIKPHEIGHRIVSCAVSDTMDHAYVFLLPGVRSHQKPLINLLANPKVGKIAQNMKFEESWSVNYLNQPVMNWVWDTMLATHIMDNRDGVTSLKFQTYVNFGVVDYENEVAAYLKAGDNKNSNSFNRIEELVSNPVLRDNLLYYNGMDAVYTHRLSNIQRNDIQLPF